MKVFIMVRPPPDLAYSKRMEFKHGFQVWFFLIQTRFFRYFESEVYYDYSYFCKRGNTQK